MDFSCEFEKGGFDFDMRRYQESSIIMLDL